MDMVTPPKIPEIDSAGACRRASVVPCGPAVFRARRRGGAVAAAAIVGRRRSPRRRKPEPALNSANAGELCLRLSENPKDYIERRGAAPPLGPCGATAATWRSQSTREYPFQGRGGAAMPHARRAEALALLREAAAQGNAEAYYELYEHHKSWDRGDLDKVPMVTRAEADRALRKAAELGHPFSTQMLAILLEPGITVKRDPVAARYWAERAVANPAKDASKGRPSGAARPPAGDVGQAGRTRPRPRHPRDEWQRPACSAPSGELAIAIRKDDPVRARTLLEEALRPDPGGATAAARRNADRRRRRPRRPQARAVAAERRAPTRRASRACWDGSISKANWCPATSSRRRACSTRPAHGTSTPALRWCGCSPTIPRSRVKNPKRVLYYATEAAELDEPGAMAALIDLKLSKNAQFQDRPGACKLIETAVSRGDQSMAQRLADCRAG